MSEQSTYYWNERNENENENNKHFAHNNNSNNNTQNENYEWFLKMKIVVCSISKAHLDQGSENTIICSQNRKNGPNILFNRKNTGSFLLDSAMNSINTEYPFIMKWLITIT